MQLQQIRGLFGQFSRQIDTPGMAGAICHGHMMPSECQGYRNIYTCTLAVVDFFRPQLPTVITYAGMGSSKCRYCNAVFTGNNCRSSRDIHIRSCRPEVDVTYSNTVKTLSRNDDGRFECYCSNPSCAKTFKTTVSIQNHAKSTFAEWLGKVSSMSRVMARLN